jgi:hypothetical protein
MKEQILYRSCLCSQQSGRRVFKDGNPVVIFESQRRRIYRRRCIGIAKCFGENILSNFFRKCVNFTFFLPADLGDLYV